ncbi:hypothetical protein B0O99DRAFT_689190 [Bisporella sp. PMI_857]|nr:hypothetical protein B0O99DRAFT_689190 [Bisporella sp. PMI_857]
MSAESTPSSSKLPRRRNGKEQACEPCRKAKIACDHNTPVCGRCRRRKSSNCVYLDAPMTKKRDSIVIPRASSVAVEQPQSSVSVPQRSTTSSSVSSVTPASSTSIRSPTNALASVRSGGFFGPTNFSAIFQENRENLGNVPIQISNDSDPYTPSFESVQSQTFLMLTETECCRGCESPRVALGMKVLRAIPDQHTFEFLLHWYFEKPHEAAFHKPMVMACAASLQKTFGRQLKEPRSTKDLEYISSILCKNGAVAAPDELNSYDAYVEAFSGMNLRWETIGMIFACLTAALLSIPERDGFYCTQVESRRNRKHFAMEMKDCVQACITLSNYMDLINMQMVALLFSNLMLQTLLGGDTSLVAWRQIGDLCSASTALGLHRELEVGRPHSFGLERRRLLFTLVFNLDKRMSMLVGRPPSLSHRYCRYTLPLDLSDEEMVNEDDFQKAVSELDENGWNTKGEIYPTTIVRAINTICVVVNEILELSLGDFEQCTNDRIKSLQSSLSEKYLSIPNFVRWDSSLLRSTETRNDNKFWRRLIFHLEYLGDVLLLERLANKQGMTDGQTMIDSAREMLDLVVLVWVQRDRFDEHHHAYDWILMCWGVPAAGVLCVQLLNQMKAPLNPQFLNLNLPRSEIVQNLSLLIGFLDWVRPAAGNYQLCGRMRQIIKQILDRILNPTPVSSQESAAQAQAQVLNSNQNQNQNFDLTGMEFDPAVFETGGFDELDNLDWLNSVDWSRGPWIDLGVQDGAAPK